ncbi:hypothetical protein V0288_22445 [Pannus brasiliensis CCIBt3594]|uniref:Uncharacterized protein n=1 Tax=Pannus brasiliensis CCIBt3594 TaxID=1427578 RepID=A0AAW9R1N9_9CHRO
MKIRQFLTGLAVASVFLSIPSIASATGAGDTTVSTDVDQLIQEAGKYDDVMEAVVPVAVASITFAAGAKVLKRVIYA